MPGFWLALLLMLYTGLEHQWLPISGLMSLDYESLSFWGKLMDLGRHLVLPITVITVEALSMGMSASCKFIHAGSPEAGLHSYGQGQRAARTRGYFPTCPAQCAPPGHYPAQPLHYPALSGQRHHASHLCPAAGQLSTPRSRRGLSAIMGTWFSAPCLLADMLRTDIGYRLADPNPRSGKRQ